MAYVGVDNIARKISKAYVGVDSIAHKIKKAYVGIGGVARPCFSGERSLDYYGAVTPLSVARYGCAAANNGTYALFSNGVAYIDGTVTSSKVVDAFNAALTRVPCADTRVISAIAAARFNDVAMFCFSGTSIDAYNSDLSRLAMPERTYGYGDIGLASTPQYAFIGGGSTYNFDTNAVVYTTAVEAYSTSNTKAVCPALNTARSHTFAAASTSYCLFIGGSSVGYTSSSLIDAYNNSLTKIGGVATIFGTTYNIRNENAPYFSDLMLFPSLQDSINYLNTYNSSLTAGVPITVPLNLCQATVTWSGAYCLYYCWSSSGAPLLLDETLTITTLVPAISGPVSGNLSSTTVGQYFLLAGGASSAGYISDTVDAYITEGD